jgi:hypothetical protein
LYGRDAIQMRPLVHYSFIFDTCNMARCA